MHDESRWRFKKVKVRIITLGGKKCETGKEISIMGRTWFTMDEQRQTFITAWLVLDIDAKHDQFPAGHQDVKAILKHYANLTYDNEKLTVFPTAKLSREQAAALASIKQIVSEKRRRVEVKLHDKLSALNALGQHLGLFKDKVEDVEAQPEVDLAESMKILMKHGFKPPNPAAMIPGIDDDLDN